MMSFADLTKIIPEILKHVSFHDYLTYKNYNFVHNKLIQGFQCYKKQTSQFDDIVYVGMVKDQQTYYSIRYNDQGNIIDFVKNRIELEGRYENFSPEKDHLIEACKELIIFLNEKGESSIQKDQNNSSKVDLRILVETSFTKHYNCQEIFDFKYLNKSSIRQETINHEIFSDKIFNSRGFVFNNEFHDVINIAFPIYDENHRECGLFYENYLESSKEEFSKLEFYAPHSVKTGIWYSNTFTPKGNRHVNLTIVNRPIEAASHFQYLKEDRRYLSVFDLEEITLTQIIHEINRHKTSLFLGFDVSIDSFIKELKVLIAVLGQNHQISFIKNNTHDVWIKIGKEEQNFFTAFLKRIRYYNNNKISNIIKVLGRHSEKFLKKDLINIVNNDNGDLIVKIPKNFKTLYKIEKILIISFPNHIPIQIEKPMYKSWRTQNEKFNEVLNEERTLENYIDNQEVFVLTSI